MRRPRLGVRSRLLVAIVAAVALALAIAVAASSVLLGRQLSANATSRAKAQAEAELSAIDVVNGTITVRESTDEGTLDSPVWVFAGTRVIEAPITRRVLPQVQQLARSLAGVPEQSRDFEERTRLYALPVVEGGIRHGTVVAAVSLEPYEETGRTVLIGSLILAALLLVAITALSHWMLGRALLPVSRMTRDAEAWGAHDVDRRFGVGEPYDEVTRLAATLDGLLGRIGASLRHEQRFTAELSHELRTPLARISGEVELMLRRERAPDEYRAALAAVGRSADEMTRTVDALVAAARLEAGLAPTTSDIRDAVHRAADNVGRSSRVGVEFRVAVPGEPVRVAADEDFVERIIQPLIDNAAQYGRSLVEVSLLRGGSTATIRVVDDGPGVAEAEASSIFEPGVRGEAASARPDGAGLGLSLARRLARSAGGDIDVRPRAGGGDFTVRLPLAT